MKFLKVLKDFIKLIEDLLTKGVLVSSAGLLICLCLYWFIFPHKVILSFIIIFAVCTGLSIICWLAQKTAQIRENQKHKQVWRERDYQAIKSTIKCLTSEEQKLFYNLIFKRTVKKNRFSFNFHYWSEPFSMLVWGPEIERSLYSPEDALSKWRFPIVCKIDNDMYVFKMDYQAKKHYKKAKIRKLKKEIF